MANENEAAVEQPEGAPHGAEGGQVDWRAKYESMLETSRKWEARSKANAEKAKGYDQMAESQQAALDAAEKAEERASKAEADLAKANAERERATIVAEVADAKGVGRAVLEIVKGDTREEIEAAADVIADYVASLHVYPSIADGGHQTAAPITKDQIDAIKDPEKRIMQRARNISLYR